RPASKCMASKTIIGSFVMLWVLTRLGIRRRPQSKIHHRGPHPLERGYDLLDFEDLETILVIVKKKRQKFPAYLLLLPHCIGALRHTIAPPYLTIGVRRVVGRERTKRVPRPRRERTSMWPCKPSMLFLTTSRPTPRPEISVTWSAVEKPGAKINCQMSVSDRPWGELMSPFAKPFGQSSCC